MADGGGAVVNDAVELPGEVGAPFPCPECGGVENWKADYYEAVSQTIDLFIGSDGGAEFGDYTGGLENYDDGATEDEAWVCMDCGHRIVHGEFRMLPVGEAEPAC